ncbi:DUF2971 domain-containing protein [Microbacterium sp. NPDC057407]|uniref:DUF2971 domain-containing protein n=1 Tax=Microbacterium sp. NPDC057407 TaxID=3346120 RepID=UPI00366BC9D7
MNDTSELEYGAGIVMSVWEGMDKTGLHPDVLELLGPVFSATEIAADALKRLHVVSACEGTNSMYQWLGYAQPDGYAIGLDMAGKWEATHEGEPGEELAEAGLNEDGFLSRLPVGWYRVIYDPAEQANAAERLVKWMSTVDATAQICRVDGTGGSGDPMALSRAQTFLRAQLQALMALFKDPAFTPEQEVRFLVEQHFSPTGTSGGGLQFRTRGATIIPALAVARRVDPEAESPRDRYSSPPPGPYELPVVGVVAGPNSAPWATDIARQVLFSKQIYWIEPKRSRLPRLAT